MCVDSMCVADEHDKHAALLKAPERWHSKGFLEFGEKGRT